MQETFGRRNTCFWFASIQQHAVEGETRHHNTDGGEVSSGLTFQIRSWQANQLLASESSVFHLLFLKHHCLSITILWSFQMVWMSWAGEDPAKSLWDCIAQRFMQEASFKRERMKETAKDSMIWGLNDPGTQGMEKLHLWYQPRFSTDQRVQEKTIHKEKDPFCKDPRKSRCQWTEGLKKPLVWYWPAFSQPVFQLGPAQLLVQDTWVP